MTETKIVSSNVVPSSLTQIGITMKYTLLDYVRSRRFFILLTIALVISAILTLVVGYYRPESFLASNLAFYSGWWGNIATYVIVLSGIFFGGDAISGEFQNKTGYFVIPNPIRRLSMYIGKWLSALIASTVILSVFTAITVGNGLYYFSSVPSEFGLSVLFAWFYLMAVLGFTFFFSSLFKSSSMSILVTAILFLFAFNIIQLFVANFAQIEPWFILTYGAQIIGNILTVPYPPPTSVTSFGPEGNGPAFTTFNATVPEGLVIMGLYFITTTVLGLILFERKEFTQ
jgi:ABC-2 type transport system permease protein